MPPANGAPQVPRLAEWIYRLSLLAYPAAFRREFGPEMMQVFCDSYRDARRGGPASLARLWLHVLGDMAIAVPHQRLAARSGPADDNADAGADGDDDEERAGPAVAEAGSSWPAVVAGVLPFLIIGLAQVLIHWPQAGRLAPYAGLMSAAGERIFWSGSFLLLLGVVAAWVMGFPRWSYSYVGYMVLFSLYLTGVPAPDSGFSTPGRPELLGVRAWLPLLAAVLVAMLVTRSPQPLVRLVRDIWCDPSRLSFAIYALAPFWIATSLREMDRGFSFPFALALAVLMVGGAWQYMAGEPQRRALAIVLTTAAVGALGDAAALLYGPSQGESWLSPGLALVALLTWVGLVALPGALVYVLRRANMALRIV